MASSGTCLLERGAAATLLERSWPSGGEFVGGSSAPSLFERVEMDNRLSTDCYGILSRSGRANTNSVLPLLGRSSGVRRLKAPDVSERPVLTATYWRPSWA